MDDILKRIASALDRRDEEPNIVLAQELVHSKDVNAIKHLVDNLANRNKKIQNDCIKVLYEIGSLNPELIADHLLRFVDYLNSKNNRLQWGAMTAIATISGFKPKEVYRFLPQIIAAADQGSVITRDQAVEILIQLCRAPKISADAFDLFIQQLAISAPNQLPMYAEKALDIINSENKILFIQTLKGRIDLVEKESKKKRIEKVILRASKIV